MKTKECKEKRIRKWLLAGETLTKLQALGSFGHNNLADIVYKMNKEKPGLIDKMWGKGFGNSRYAIYAKSSVIKSQLSLLNKSK